MLDLPPSTLPSMTAAFADVRDAAGLDRAELGRMPDQAELAADALDPRALDDLDARLRIIAARNPADLGVLRLVRQMQNLLRLKRAVVSRTLASLGGPGVES